MERELASHLQALARAYANATGLKISTIARHAANDWRFFDRLDDPECTFTARKYDEIVRWFASNWPQNKRLPQCIPLVSREACAREGARA